MNVFREHSTNRLPTILRHFMGQGAPWSVEMVSEITGIGTSTIYHHMSESGNKPNADHILAYASLFGADFLNLWTQGIGITGAYRPKALEGCIFKNTLHGIGHASNALGTLSSAAEDGKIDATERRSVPVHILTATAYLNALAANYGASA